MACSTPLRGYKAAPGMARGGFTFNIKKSTGVRITVNCGKCDDCRIRWSRELAMRVMHELQFHSAACFLTLTYSDEFVPPQLVYSHMDLFLDRLRKRLGPFRYIYCGEYGDVSFRPHFHVVILGLDFSDRYLHSGDGDLALYRSSVLESLWTYGMSTIGRVTMASAVYVTQYVMKHSKDVPVSWVPERCFWSTRPALGKYFVGLYGASLVKRGSTTVLGQKVPLPRYYDKILKECFPEEFSRMKDERVARAVKRADQLHLTAERDRMFITRSRRLNQRRKKI